MLYEFDTNHWSFEHCIFEIHLFVLSAICFAVCISSSSSWLLKRVSGWTYG